MSRLRTATAVLLGLSMPVLLTAALWAADWRYAVTAVIAGATGLVVGTAPGAPRRKAPWPPREDV